MKDWKEFERFHNVIEKYMPDYGEGETMASQAVTAVNKLVYKWYNDGDVYDNTGALEGWCNDLSSYANWLYTYFEDYTKITLDEIFDCYTGDDYEDLLYKLAEDVFNDELLKSKYDKPAVGSIYNCDGPFRFVEDNEYDEEW